MSFTLFRDRSAYRSQDLMLVYQYIFMVHKLLLAVFRTPMRCSKLESEAERISSSTTAAPTKSRNKLIAIIAIVAVAVIAGAFLVSAFLSSPQGHDAWLFKGAYAEYEGTTSMAISFMTVSFSVTVRQEVVDFNSTHAQLRASLSMSSSASTPEENAVTIWVDLSKNQYQIDESTLVNSYEANLPFTGFGNRDCIVYEYATDGPTITIYVDKQIGWPLKMNMSMTGEGNLSLSLDLILVETNIPALQ